MKTKMETANRIILIDADVVSHFVIAGEAEALCRIFPLNPIHLLDKVHAELQRWPNPAILSTISELLSRKKIHLMDFPEEDETIKQEYNWIKSMLFKGDGESACLAVARYRQQILASSNLKDIKNYCTTHKINYLTTMDFLCEALRSGFFNEERCNLFIKKVKEAKSNLPVSNMKEYECRKISFLQ